MKKETFVKAIEAIQKQVELDKERNELLAKVYDCRSSDLCGNNDTIINGLIDVLKTETKDTGDWIEHYLWELDFGKENYRLKVWVDEIEIPLSNAGELWDLLKMQKSK